MDQLFSRIDPFKQLSPTERQRLAAVSREKRYAKGETIFRAGLAYWKQALEPFTTLPPYEESPDAYRDWGADIDFSLGGMGPGECAA